MTKADDALYRTLDLTWHVLDTMRGKIKDYRTADKDGIIEDDLLNMRNELARWREFKREVEL